MRFWIRRSGRVSFIDFIDHGIPFGKKTHFWTVVPKSDGPEIGEVKWYAQWRKYCFYAAGYAIFEEVCLREIAEFVEARTREHRAARKAA